MDFNLKQWRDHESEQEDQQQASASKLPRLHLNSHSSSPPSSSAQLSLSAPSESTKLHRMESCSSSFNMAQRQELLLQILIFKKMAAGASVPPELLHRLKKTLNSSTDQYYPYNYHHLCNPLYNPHYQTQTLVQPSSGGGYWSRVAMDPDPRRSRRTDGKKWRCSGINEAEKYFLSSQPETPMSQQKSNNETGSEQSDWESSPHNQEEPSQQKRRPIGQKTAKRKDRGKVVQSSESTYLQKIAESLQQIAESHVKVATELQSFNRNSETYATEQSLWKAYSLCKTDTSDMIPEVLQVHETLKDFYKKQYGWKF